MIAFVHLLQALTLLAWCGPAWLSLGVMRNIIRGRATRQDVRSSFRLFYAVLQIGFSVRWFLWPSQIGDMGSVELLFWAGLYILSIILAVAITIFVGKGRV